MKDKTIFLGIDLGTGGCKISVVDEKGNIVAEGKKNILQVIPNCYIVSKIHKIGLMLLLMLLML